MKRNFILFFLLLITLGIFAQESLFEKERREYLSATVEQKALMDSIYQPIADKIAKDQVKTIGGIPFGISHSKAEVMLRNKFGIPNSDPSTTTLSFNNIKYAGHDFASVYFMFQSDGINSYLNGCIFITKARSLSDAIEKEKYIADEVLSKYTVFLNQKTQMDILFMEEAFHLFGTAIGPHSILTNTVTVCILT